MNKQFTEKWPINSCENAQLICSLKHTNQNRMVLFYQSQFLKPAQILMFQAG